MASNRKLRPFRLETFSHWCAKKLLDRHPEWLPFVDSDEQEQDGLSVRTLAIHLPSQNPKIPEPLSITMGLDRIIYLYWFPILGSTRWHYEWVFFMAGIINRGPDWVNDESGIDIVVDFVEKFLNEEIAAIYKGDDIKGFDSFGIVSAQDVRERTFRPGKARTEIRSWKGSLDLSL